MGGQLPFSEPYFKTASWSDTRNLVIKDRRAVGDGTVSLAKRTTVLTAKDVDG